MSQDKTTQERVEAAAKILAKWLGYAWDGLDDRDISAEYPDWCFHMVGGLKLQGGRPALRRIAAEMISAASFPGEDIANLTIARAAALGKARYWDVHNLDAFPAGVAILLADAYYNGGYPVIWLQETLGVTADGIVGAATRAAMAAADPVRLLQRFTARRLAYLAGLPEAPHDMVGWANRCLIMLTVALGASGGVAAVSFA